MTTAVARWLDAFARCVRERDFVGGQALCAPSVRGFGTCAEYVDGTEDLLARQWLQVWPRTRGFRFDEPAVTELSDDGTLVCILTRWESEGLADDGGTFRRRGRGTIVLRRMPHGEYLAVHTHFSRAPDGTL